MKLSKRILKHPIAQSIICFIAAQYIRLVFWTSKVRILGNRHVKKLRHKGKPYILAFWHGRLFMIPHIRPRHKRCDVVISHHNDGELIAKVIPHFGLRLIRGSSKHKGMQALKDCFKSLKKGNCVAITPDGPRGPRMRVGGNIVSIAHKMDVPILPVTFAASKHKLFKSWDRFMLPKLFGKVVFIQGKPLHVGKDCEGDIEKAGRLLENRLNRITRKADQMVGAEPVEAE